MKHMSAELSWNIVIHLYAINLKYFAYQREEYYWLTIWCVATDIMIVSHTN